MKVTWRVDSNQKNWLEAEAALSTQGDVEDFIDMLRFAEAILPARPEFVEPRWLKHLRVLVSDGAKIAAIKLWRAVAKADLVESKDFIEGLMNGRRWPTGREFPDTEITEQAIYSTRKWAGREFPDPIYDRAVSRQERVVADTTLGDILGQHDLKGTINDPW